MYNTPTDGTEALEKAEILNTFFSSTFTDERLEDIPINTEKPFLGKLDSFVITPETPIIKPREITRTCFFLKLIFFSEKTTSAMAWQRNKPWQPRNLQI